MWDYQGALLPTGEGIWRGRTPKGMGKVRNPGLSASGVEVQGEHLQCSMGREDWEVLPAASDQHHAGCVPAVVREQGSPVLEIPALPATLLLTQYWQNC